MSDNDFEELEIFLDTNEPDDHDIRVNALTLAIKHLAGNCIHHDQHQVVHYAEKFYGFLTDG